MKRALLLIAVTMMLAVTLAAAANNDSLDKVLNEMDRAAAGFKGAQADFVWDQFTSVVKDHDNQKGTIYFRRESKGIQMMAEINDPKKYVLYSGNTVQVYQPSIDQATKYNVGKNKSEVESFMVLGFGGRGHDMLKSFDVKYSGTEKIGNVDAQKLELTPKSAAMRNNFNRIVLWIDPATGMSVQQQAFSPNGDYRLAQYTNIKKNEKIPDTVFKLKTTPSTKWNSPS